MPPFEVFLHLELLEQVPKSRRRREMVTKFIYGLRANPHTPGDFSEKDESLRIRQVKIIGDFAVTYGVDDAVKAVMIVEPEACRSIGLPLRGAHLSAREMIKRLLLSAAVVLVVLAGSVLATGWLLARPVAVQIGSPPADLDAQAVHFRSESGANVSGWWCPVPQSRGSILPLPGGAGESTEHDRTRSVSPGGSFLRVVNRFSSDGRNDVRSYHLRLAGKP